jgi:hypothetical protein
MTASKISAAVFCILQLSARFLGYVIYFLF